MRLTVMINGYDYDNDDRPRCPTTVDGVDLSVDNGDLCRSTVWLTVPVGGGGGGGHGPVGLVQ